MKIKHDKFQKIRGGKVKIDIISCSKCKSELFIYQKDGSGPIHRCYINRIIKVISAVENGNGLYCTCGEKIGTKIIHTDGRQAYAIIRTSINKKIYK